jgi:glycosyltransferase involved in cell wall biosynthesis
MKVLLCHNYYQHAGGEDEVFAAEGALLEAHGHEVVRFTRHNDDIKGMGRVEVARKTLWNRATYDELLSLIRRERPRVMHCTNTFPLISPAAYDAARAEGVAVVQSLHNYRLFCLNSLFLRDGRACELCLGKAIPWPGVLHKCYRESRSASAVVASMLTYHRARGTYRNKVDVYIALTEFARRKFEEGGFDPGQIVVKPNFLSTDPGLGQGKGGYAVFVGRLSTEKGVEPLVNAWTQHDVGVPLKVIGDGPQAEPVRQAAAAGKLEWLGRRPLTEVLEVIGDAAFLILPSICYETFGRTIIEAYSRGTPVIVSRQGAIAELVVDGRTGLLFEPGNAEDLAAKVRQLGSDPALRERMRQDARQEFEQKYTAERNHGMLMAIYEQACRRQPSVVGNQLSASSPQNSL